MKKYLLLGACCLAAAAAFCADLSQAENLYREGRYAAALGEYEQMLQTYPNNPYLYYNIGNCYFKMGSKGLAAANYYRAFRLAPRDKDIRHNLQLVFQAAGEQWIPAGMPEVLHRVFFGLTLTELKGLLFVTLWLFCMLGCVWLIKRRWGWCLGTAFVILLLSTAWYGARRQTDGQTLAVVAAPTAELRSGPGDNFPANAHIAQGHLLLLQDSRNDWREVVVKSQGIQGWMKADSLESI